LLGGQHIAQRSLLREVRTREAAADEAAVNYLAGIGLSPEGMRQFMAKLNELQSLSDAPPSPYLLTHPLTRDRMEVMASKAASSTLEDDPPQEEEVIFQRIKAKITAFTQFSPNRVLELYPDDGTFVSSYARSIAFSRLGKTNEALAILNGLLKTRPQDAFLNELKGYVLLKGGKVNDAITWFRKGAAFKPDNSSLATELAAAELESNNPTIINDATTRLIRVVRSKKTSNRLFAWWLLAAAYGKQGFEGDAALARAEWHLILGDAEKAQTFAKRAMNILAPQTPAWRRAKSITILPKKK